MKISFGYQQLPLWLLTAAVILLPAAAFAQRGNLNRYLSNDDEWFASTDSLRIAENVLSYQTPDGGWPKNINMVSRPADPAQTYEATIDNRSTYPQLQYLARVYTATQDARWKEAFLKGLDYLLKSQYPNGGWPQYYPLREGYYTHITYNDGAMVGVLRLLRDVHRDKTYAFVDDARREACRKAVESGLDCILKCQVLVGGKRTVWCQQHDETTLAPTNARAYELVSLSGMESAEIALFLMDIEHPSPEIRAAVEGAVAWFEQSKLAGIRIERIDGNRTVVADPAAPPLWARFYDIETNKPFFCGRDGIKKSSMAEIEAERRNGYSWYSNAPQNALDAYPDWKARNTVQ